MRKLSRILAVTLVVGSSGVALADRAHHHFDPRNYRALAAPETLGAPAGRATDIFEDDVHETRTGGPSGGIN